jgi:polyisoprenoid-binding protein YceI
LRLGQPETTHRLSRRVRPGGLFFLVFVLLATLVLAFEAEAETLTLDPSATEITFELDATGHTVRGTLYLTSGEIEFDPVTGSASGEIRLDARQTDTNNPRRDKKLHEKVLESAKFPTIVFRSQRIEGSQSPAGKVRLEGTSEFELIGTLELLGREHPLSIAARAEIRDRKVEARASFAVPYVEWGLHDPSVLILRVGKIVQVELETSGTLTP